MKRVNSTIERIRRIKQLLDEKSYVREHEKLPMWRRFAHFWLLVYKSFQKNRGAVRAAALAYTTILSLVPVLAVVVSISTGMLQRDQGAINDLMDKFITKIAPQLDLIQTAQPGEGGMNRREIVEKIQSYINALNSGTLGLTGGLALVFIVISVLSSVENTFNDIWGVARGRTWSARIVQYWAAITLAPIFIVTAFALTTSAQLVSASKQAQGAISPTNVVRRTNIVLQANPKDLTVVNGESEKLNVGATNAVPVKTQVVTKVRQPNFFERINDWVRSAPVLGAMIEKLGPFVLPFVVLTIFLAVFYRLMPNTRVRWDAAFIGGVVGGGLLQLNNLFSIVYFSKVLTYSKIYGSLGAIPIFLIGLYFSWLIILWGAQVAYAYQNRQAYVQEKQAESIHQRGREFVALRMMTYIAQSFYLGHKPPTRLHISDALGVPAQLACDVLGALFDAGLLVEVSGEDTAYSPGRPIDKITVEDILAALRVGKGTGLETSDDPSRIVVRGEYDRIVLAEMHAAGAVTLQDLVLRAGSLPAGGADLEAEPHLAPAAV